MTWESQEPAEPRITRRHWVKWGLATAAFAAGAAATSSSALLLERLLPPPTLIPGQSLQDTLIYRPFPTDQWWNAKANDRVRVTDFALWAGATAVWRGIQDTTGAIIPDTGYTVLLVRVPRVDTYHSLPNPLPWRVPPGAALFYDDPARDIRIVAAFDRCTHICCYPGWHVVTNLPPPRNYLVPTPTYDVYHQDPVWCICHDAQYDPLVLMVDTNPQNGVVFPGLELVHAPGAFALPLVPLHATDDVLEGVMIDSRWYGYC